MLAYHSVHAIGNGLVKWETFLLHAVTVDKFCLKISPYSLEKTSVVSFYWCVIIKRCFPSIIAKVLRTPILKNICEGLLLETQIRIDDKGKLTHII